MEYEYDEEEVISCHWAAEKSTSRSPSDGTSERACFSLTLAVEDVARLRRKVLGIV